MKINELAYIKCGSNNPSIRGFGHPTPEFGYDIKKITHLGQMSEFLHKVHANLACQNVSLPPRTTPALCRIVVRRRE